MTIDQAKAIARFLADNHDLVWYIVGPAILYFVKKIKDPDEREVVHDSVRGFYRILVRRAAQNGAPPVVLDDVAKELLEHAAKEKGGRVSRGAAAKAVNMLASMAAHDDFPDIPNMSQEVVEGLAKLDTSKLKKLAPKAVK